MADKPTPKTMPVQGRVDYSIYEWLEQRAKNEERSIGYYVAKAVEAYYKAELDKESKAYPLDKP